MRNSHVSHCRDLTDLLAAEVVVQYYFGLIVLLPVWIQTVYAALLGDGQNVQARNLADIIYLSSILALYFALRYLLFQIPNVNRAGFIARYPGLEILEVPDITLVLLTA